MSNKKKTIENGATMLYQYAVHNTRNEQVIFLFSLLIRK